MWKDTGYGAVTMILIGYKELGAGPKYIVYNSSIFKSLNQCLISIPIVFKNLPDEYFSLI